MFFGILTPYIEKFAAEKSRQTVAVAVVFTFTNIVYANLDVHETHESILQMSVYHKIYHSLSDVATTVAATALESEKKECATTAYSYVL